MDLRKCKSSTAFYFTLNQRYLEASKSLRENINLGKGQVWLNVHCQQQNKGSLHHRVLAELALQIEAL